MNKVSELTGALLDYWVSRAEGVPAEELTIEPVPRTAYFICVRRVAGAVPRALNWSSEPTLWAPLIEKYRFDLLRGFGADWMASPPGMDAAWFCHGHTPEEAICRAVVRAAFGDEVGEVSAC